MARGGEDQDGSPLSRGAAARAGHRDDCAVATVDAAGTEQAAPTADESAVDEGTGGVEVEPEPEPAPTTRKRRRLGAARVTGLLLIAILAISLLTGPLADTLPGERARRTLEVLLTAGIK